MQPITQTITGSNGEKITIETGKLAKQADGSVVVRQGDTMLLAAVVSNKNAKDFQNFEFELIRFSSMTSPFTEEEFGALAEKELTNKLYEFVTEHYKNKIERNAVLAFPVIKDVFENEGDRYERDLRQETMGGIFTVFPIRGIGCASVLCG
mgnify:CR=1 FL=1